MYSFFVKPTANKKTMGLVHSSLFPQKNMEDFLTKIFVVEQQQKEPQKEPQKEAQKEPQKEEQKITIGNKTSSELFTLHSTSKDIEYPTSNSILKTNDSFKSEVFTSELYESCVLSFSIVEIIKDISVGLNNNDKYYGLKFTNDKYRIILSDAIESDIDTPPDQDEFDYEIGDNFKIIHLSNEINIFKNEYKIYTSNKKERENDSYRALFTLFNKEDEIRNIKFYYVHQNRCNCLKQGSTIVVANSMSNNIKISDSNSFYLLEGVPSLISGITRGKNGQRITIINNSGNKQIFSDNNMNSLSENRLYLGGNDILVKHKTSIHFLYVFDLNKWVLL